MMVAVVLGFALWGAVAAGWLVVHWALAAGV
jgi:hypothetical protein